MAELEYLVGEEDTNPVPELIQQVADRIAQVREASAKLWAELYPRNRKWPDTITEPDPVRRERINISLADLDKEEARLLKEFEDLKWLLPPALVAPHNATLSKEKAGIILEEGEVRGHPLTDKQKRFFGWVAGGSKPRKGES